MSGYESQPIVRTNASLPITQYDDDPSRVDLGMHGERDQPTVWSAVNYPNEHQFDFESFYLRYERQAIARAIIDKPVNDTWQAPPTVRDEGADTDTDEPDTDFEEDTAQFFDGEFTRRSPTHRLNVADKLGRLGHYSLIVLGFADGRDLSTPVAGVQDDETGEFNSPDDLMYIATFGEDRVIDMEIDRDMASPRYRLPKTVEVITQEYEDNDEAVSEDDYETQEIHWTRLIHVPEGTLEDDLNGTPALKPVFHELLNIDKIKAASGEGYWRAGYQGLVIRPPFNDQGQPIEFEDGSEGVQKEIDKFLNNFQRTIATTADVENLGGSVGDPSSHLQANYQAISAALDLPLSVMLGKEKADRASNEDVRQWHQKIGERRNNFAEPVVLEPLVQRLIDVGVFSEPSGEGFGVEWEPLDELSEQEEANLNKTISETLSNLSPSQDPTHLGTIPELRKAIGWTPEMGAEVDEEFRDQEELEANEEQLAEEPPEPPDEQPPEPDDMNEEPDESNEQPEDEQ